LADVNICYMEHARRNLIKENYNSQYIFVVGSPIKEVFKNIEDKIELSNILNLHDLHINDYFVWSTHRESNIDNSDNFLKIVNCINSLAQKYNKKIIFSVHPRTSKKIKENNIIFDDHVILCEPFGILDYYYLQKNSLCVISDSGTLTEEANILNFRAVLLRTSTEHPEGVENGTVMIGNIEWDILEQSINMCINLNKSNNVITEYNCDKFSEKIIKIILGYFNIVNRFIWMK
jgi:UDP-N-acetylglucosamine 2-epimerase